MASDTSISPQQQVGHIDRPMVAPIWRQPYKPRIPHFIKNCSGPFTVSGNQYCQHSCNHKTALNLETAPSPYSVIGLQSVVKCQLTHLDVGKDDSDRANWMKMALTMSRLQFSFSPSLYSTKGNMSLSVVSGNMDTLYYVVLF